MKHSPRNLQTFELEQGLAAVCESPREQGVLKLIVRRPAENEREVIEAGELSCQEGLVGDNWQTRGSTSTDDGSAHPEMQLNVMNSRMIALIAQDADRWELAGDQLYLDMDLSQNNLPPGTQLAIGSAVIEVTAEPHVGCEKFVSRFGRDAMKFVNSTLGRKLRLRGLNAKVAQAGKIQVGNLVTKTP